ncbi:MAG: TIGR03619 family F420-dependent LLM class oxidoreductase [Actinomycetota bacterium]|nr:TIGR03619 family F420-dependent LLM class oxidoreductase [Actinomycetota bacterium]
MQSGSSEPRVGVMFANGALAADPEHAATLAVAAEQAGYDSLWAVQHVVMPVQHASEYPYSPSGTVPGGTAVAIPDPLVWLAWAGARTSTILLATGVLVLPQQHPLVVAKQAATLDRLTRGRLLLGLGAGWLQEEFEALGSQFDGRGQRMEECIQVLRLSGEPGPTEFHGAQIDFAPVWVEPKPARQIPLLIGGHTTAAARRAGRLADGFFPLSCQGEALTKLVALVREAAEQVGRDPLSIEITADAPRTPQDAAVQRELGVHRVVVNAPHVPTEELAEALQHKLDATREVCGPA